MDIPVSDVTLASGVSCMADDALLFTDALKYGQNNAETLLFALSTVQVLCGCLSPSSPSV
jgi:hypothetical protein